MPAHWKDWAMSFKTPWILFLIPFILGLLWIYHKRIKPAAIRFSSTQLLSSLTSSWKLSLKNFPFFLRLAALTFFLIALAGPRSVLEKQIHQTEGIDIVLAIDASGSMAGEDFKIEGRRVNRLAVVKKAVKDFIEARPNDRLGLIAFGAYAYTVCPLTTDHDWLLTNLERVELGTVEDGTAIGSGILTSVNRLKTSEAKSKVVILLTDGMNNAGKVDPVAAAHVAEKFKIKIYTIGAGSKGYVPFPMQDFFGRTVYQNVLIDLDEDTLKEAAKLTGGKYFRATDTESLQNIYKEIDALEKTKIEEYGFKEYKELFDRFLILALLVLLVEIVLKETVLLKIP